WAFVKLAVSWAKSVSRMTASAAVVFSKVLRRLLAVDSRVLDWKAPRSARWVLIWPIALSMTARESWAPLALVTLIAFRLANWLPKMLVPSWVELAFETDSEAV